MQQRKFKPARELTAEQRAGDVTDGQSWHFWRYDSDGHPWFKLAGTITTEEPLEIEAPQEAALVGVQKQAGLVGVSETTFKKIMGDKS